MPKFFSVFLFAALIVANTAMTIHEVRSMPSAQARIEQVRSESQEIKHIGGHFEKAMEAVHTGDVPM